MTLSCWQCTEFPLKLREEVEAAVDVFYTTALVDETHAKPIAFLCEVRLVLWF